MSAVKTLSMVNYAFELREAFPGCKIYSNINLFGIAFVNLNSPKKHGFKTSEELLVFALAERRGAKGVLILLDEAHLYFHKSKGIPLDVLTAISQQRKDRRKLVFSSQIWEELDISLRKQVKEIVGCRTAFFGLLEINTVSDGETLTYDKMAGAYVAKKITLTFTN